MTYKRVLLKLSGEALMGDKPYGIDPAIVQSIAEDVSKVVSNNVQLAIVVGGGNIFRGLKGSADGMDRATADYVGMLATPSTFVAFITTSALISAALKAAVVSVVKKGFPHPPPNTTTLPFSRCLIALLLM